jgi:hypothetical protein
VGGGDGGARTLPLCLPPLVYVNKPVALVTRELVKGMTAARIPLNRMTRRLEENKRKFAGGGNFNGWKEVCVLDAPVQYRPHMLGASVPT